MARNRNAVLDFFQGFNQGYDTTGRVLDDIDLSKIARAKPEQSQGFTAEDGKQLEAIANAKDADGKPLYTLTANEDGSYDVASAADPSMRGTIAQRGVTDFLGNRTAGTLTDDQVTSARQQAMAGVISRTNPVAGMQMLNSIKQGLREDQRFGWEQATNERALRKADQADADDEAIRGADAATSEWLQNRLRGEDGTSRAGTVDDHLAASSFRAMRLAEAGRLNEASQVYRDYAAQSMIKLQMEGAEREQALGKASAALAAGDLDGVKDFYNRFIPDGAHVTSVTRGNGGQIVIERETSDGRKLPSTVMKDTGQLASALTAFKDPMAIYNYAQNEFRNNLAIRADNRAAAANSREQAAFDAQAPQRQLASTVATLQLGLGNTDDPKERADLSAKLGAVTAGAFGAKKDPPTGYRWKTDGSGHLEPIPGGPGDKAGAPGKIPAEVQRMNIAMRSLKEGLNEYEALLKTFNPRNPISQMSPETRARMQSLVADMQLQYKEAQALGALTGPDVELIEKALANPASIKGFSYGRSGLAAQLSEVRKSLDRRSAAVAQEFNLPAPAGAASQPAAAPAAAAASGAATDYSNLWGGKKP